MFCRRGLSPRQFLVLAFLIGGVFPFALRDRWGGSAPPTLGAGATTTLSALVLVILIYHLTGRLTLALAGTAGVIAGMAPSLGPGLETVTPLFFALLLLLLIRARADSGAARALWAVPLLFGVWTNCDGACEIGLALLGIHWLAEEWEAAVAGHGAAPAHVRVLRLVLPASAAACLVNPYCYHALAMGGAAPRAALMPAVVLPGNPPDLANPRDQAVLMGGLLLLIGALGFSPRRRRPADVGLALLVTFLALASQRHLALFLIGIVPAAAAPLGKLLHEAAVMLGDAPGVRHLGASPFGQRGSARLQQISSRRSPLYWIPLAMLCGWAVLCVVAPRPAPKGGGEVSVQPPVGVSGLPNAPAAPSPAGGQRSRVPP